MMAIEKEQEEDEEEERIPVMSFSSSYIDANQLRRALRVIHCLQRERGASGAFFAIDSHNNDGSSLGNTATMNNNCNSMPLATARVDTDRAFQHMHDIHYGRAYGGNNAQLVVATAQIALQKIRNMIDRSDRNMFPSFRRFLVSFSTLISSVIHEMILRYTTGGGGVLNNTLFAAADHRCPGSRPMSRIHSSASIHSSYAVVNTEKLGHHRRSRSDGNSVPTLSSHPNRSSLYSLSSHASQGLLMLLERQKSVHGGGGGRGGEGGGIGRRRVDERDNLLSLGHLSLFTSSDSWNCGDLVVADIDATSEFLEENKERVKRLLGLLGIFVQIKESTGVVRATLTSTLVFEEHNANLLVNDIVLEIENQRRQLEVLQTQVKPGPMRNLVIELVRMSPDMQQVQESLLCGFSLDGFKKRFNSDKLWNVMTVYIDKLHSLELLIVEEIEAARDRVDIVPSTNLSGAWMAAFGTGRHDSKEDLIRSIETLSPEEVKKRLISALKADSSLHNHDELEERASSKGVDDLLNELRNAPASKEWEIGIYEIRFMKRIGQGSAGTTYIADWSGLQVAVKVASISEMGLEGWRTEVQALQKLHHPNIIRLLGSVYHPHPLTFCLVLEYCDAGDLQDVLLRVTPRNFFFHVSTSIAKGVAYLHNRSIIHRDIKPSNVLLNGDVASGIFQVKVTDFGVSTDLNSSRNLTAETGTYRWMSPEVIRHEKYTQTADVYSFAVLMWQLITREEPFADRGQIEAAVAVSMESKRPPLPPGTPFAISSFLAKAWAENPQVRPSFEEICEMLIEIESGLLQVERRWIESPLGHPVYNRIHENLEVNDGAEIKVHEVETPGASHIAGVAEGGTGGKHNPPQSQSKLKSKEAKRGKKFSLFSRKSSHF